ncbi:MAG: Ppx/GppA family phosphatase [Coriobacteriia bacterium]|nr:Ppx/GppA family phosphatase [Coriobacteriia bacterium]
MSMERVAVIDIGTVTARLMVAEVADGAIGEVVRRSVITHLGEGWTGSGVLAEPGMARVAEAVRSFVAEADSLGVSRTVAVATSAARDAVNGEVFVRRIESAGVRPEIISGEREGYLTFLGATYDRRDERILMVDVGGGSTELVLGSGYADESGRRVEIELSRSIDVGSRRVTELFLHSDPPTARDLDEAAGWVADEMRSCFSAMSQRPREMVSVAGTATSLAAIDLSLDPYDPERVHGYRISGPALLDMIEHLAGLTLRERQQVVGLEPERAGVIVGGALVLQSAMAYAGLSSTLVSEHDILYGMALDLG